MLVCVVCGCREERKEGFGKEAGGKGWGGGVMCMCMCMCMEVEG